MNVKEYVLVPRNVYKNLIQKQCSEVKDVTSDETPPSKTESSVLSIDTKTNIKTDDDNKTDDNNNDGTLNPKSIDDVKKDVVENNSYMVDGIMNNKQKVIYKKKSTKITGGKRKRKNLNDLNVRKKHPKFNWVSYS